MATINNEDQISYSFDDNKSINSLRGYVTDDDMYVIKRKELLNIGKIDLSKCSITYSFRMKE